MDRLGDHVRIGVLRNRSIQQPRMVLAVHVLLDGTAGPADAHRVGRDAVVFDEVLLQHQCGLAAELQVVVGVRAQARRVDDGVAEAEHWLEQRRALTDRALVMADRHATLKAEHEPPVPQRIVRTGSVGLGRRSQHRHAVDEPVDRAQLPAHHIRDGATVERRRGGHIARELSEIGEMAKLPTRRLVDVGDTSRCRAVLAPPDDRRGRRRVTAPVARIGAVRRLGGDRDSETILVVDERLTQQPETVERRSCRRTHERLLLRSGEDRPTDRVVDERHHRRSRPSAATPIRRGTQLVGAHVESLHETDECSHARHGRERPGDVRTIERHRHLMKRDGARHLDAHQGVATADLLGRTRQHLDGQLAMPAGIRCRAGERGHRQPRNNRRAEQRHAPPPSAPVMPRASPSLHHIPHPDAPFCTAGHRSFHQIARVVATHWTWVHCLVIAPLTGRHHGCPA